jgi:hypothetical protein
LQNFVKNFDHDIDYKLNDYYYYNYINFTDNDFGINTKELFRSFKKEIGSVINGGEVLVVENNGFFFKNGFGFKFDLKSIGIPINLFLFFIFNWIIIW